MSRTASPKRRRRACNDGVGEPSRDALAVRPAARAQAPATATRLEQHPLGAAGTAFGSAAPHRSAKAHVRSERRSPAEPDGDGRWRDRAALLRGCRVGRKNASQVLAASRQAGLAVVHTHLVSATANGRDVPELMKRHGLWATGDTPEAQFLEAVRPAPKELVLARTSFSFFTPELGDQLLRNLGITTLIVAGVATDAAVASTVRDAADRGYSTILVEDACAASSRQDHGASVDFLELWYCEVAKAAEVAKAVARRAIVEKEEGDDAPPDPDPPRLPPPGAPRREP